MGRGYAKKDMGIISQIGTAAGFISVLVLALYVNAEKHLYSNPNLIWFCCPLMLYWVSRVWILAGRGEIHQDPVIFALKDAVSYLIFTLAIVLLVAAGWIGG